MRVRLGFVPIWLGSAIELAECRQMTSMITSANRNAAVIIVNWRRDHEFVIIASFFCIYSLDVVFYAQYYNAVGLLVVRRVPTYRPSLVTLNISSICTRFRVLPVICFSTNYFSHPATSLLPTSPRYPGSWMVFMLRRAKVLG